MAKDTRIDFSTTTERKEWLKKTAAKQEISVSQLLNRLIRNRMKTEERFKKTTTSEEQEQEDNHPKKTMAELIKEIEEAHQPNEINDDEEDLPF